MAEIVVDGIESVQPNRLDVCRPVQVRPRLGSGGEHEREVGVTGAVILSPGDELLHGELANRREHHETGGAVACLGHMDKALVRERDDKGENRRQR